jgi:hypothetical protein
MNDCLDTIGGFSLFFCGSVERSRLATNWAIWSLTSWFQDPSNDQLNGTITTQLAARDIFRPTRWHEYNSVGCSHHLTTNSMARLQLSWLLPPSYDQLDDTNTTQLAARDILRPTQWPDHNSVGCSRHLTTNSMTRIQLSWLLPPSFDQLDDTITTQLAAPTIFRPTRWHDYNSVGCSHHLSTNSMTRSQLSWLLATEWVLVLINHYPIPTH